MKKIAKKTVKKSLIASALLISATVAPTGAFANYYGYERCMNNGGNWFSCLGELADGMVSAPDLESQFGFAKEDGEDRIMESIKARSEICDAQKEKARMSCYATGLKADLRAVAVEKPAVAAPVKAPAMKMQSGAKAAIADK